MTFRATKNTDFKHYIATPKVILSGSQIVCRYSSLILGDTTPPLPPSPANISATSFIDSDTTTRVLDLHPTTTPAAVTYIYHLDPPMPTPSLESTSDPPASTLSNGLPDPSYSAELASWQSVASSVSSYNSVQMSAYTVAFEASKQSVYGTITITTVDSDSALTTVTTDNYNAWAASQTHYIVPNENTTGNSTDGNNVNEEPVTGLSLGWTIGMMIVLCAIATCFGYWFIHRHEWAMEFRI